jgi:hypothetical protein
LTHGEDNGRARWPEEYATLERLGTENLDAIESTVRTYGMSVDFGRTGELSVASSPTRWGGSRRPRRRVQVSSSIGSRWLSADNRILFGG